MRKNILIALAIFGALGITLVVGTGNRANAQLFPTNSSTTPSSTVVNATTTASATTTEPTTTPIATSVTNPVPIYVVATSTASLTTVPPSAGYLQLNNLTVASVSAAGTAPMQIMASGSGATCEQFVTDNAPTGTSAACPTPTMVTTTSSAEYTVMIDAASSLLTSDRASTNLSTIMPGDQINVYGYYDGIGTMDAEIVRDLSRSSASTGTTSVNTGTGVSTTAELQAELNQLETLAIQLEAELGMTTTTLPVSCPMIPAGATSTAGCVPAGATTTSSTIYE